MSENFEGMNFNPYTGEKIIRTNEETPAENVAETKPAETVPAESVADAPAPVAPTEEPKTQP